MQRNGWKLADVLHGRVPCQTVIEIGYDADVDTHLARFVHQGDDHLLVGGNGEEDLVDEQRARQPKAVAHIADDIGIARFRLRFGQRDESAEAKAEVPHGFQVIAQRVRHAARTDDKHVAGVHAFAEAGVDHGTPECPAGAQHCPGQQDRQDDRNAGEMLAAGEIDGAAQDQARDQGRLQGQALLIQAAAVLDGTV